MRFHGITIALALAAAPYVIAQRLRINPQIRSEGSSLEDYYTTAGLNPWSSHSVEKRGALDTNPDGSTFLWLLQDEYSGKTFFDRWNFFAAIDPTNGAVVYVNRSAAFDLGLAYVQDDGAVVMKGDDTTWLSAGTFRNSVRISSQAEYNGGLFVLDVNRAPWGCGVWPAFWTLGGGTWPYAGEIDILEGVHDNEHNQITWHTGPGCTLTPTANFTGTIVQMDGQNYLDCDGLINHNAGCGVTERSKASYGPYFDSQGGGAFVMKWDENGISVWSFYRQTIPQDILDGSPNPANWGPPSAALDPTNCNPMEYFSNHSVVFDITFCGDWAGNSYATTDCPGTCEERLIDPNNFVNASWSINSLKIYRKQLFKGRVNGAPALPNWGSLDLVLAMIVLTVVSVVVV